MDDPDDAYDQDEAEHDGDLCRRTFLERHDWIPWIAAAIVVGAGLGFIVG